MTTQASARERQVVVLLAAGMTHEAIGLELGIEPRTVKSYCDVLRRKLGADTAREIPMVYRLKTGEDVHTEAYRLLKGRAA